MSRTKSQLHRRAFTMIEVMIVVVLLAITAVIAVPMVGDRSDIKLAAAARASVADLQYAQNYAVATRETIYVRFGVDQYTLCRKVGTTLTPLTHPIERSDYVVKFNTAGASQLRGVSLAKPTFAGNSVLGFDSLGVPFSYNETTSAKAAYNTRGTLTFTCRGRQQLIYIEPYTGEISVP